MNFNLSEREKEVMDLVAKGMSNKQIAGKLCISKATVPCHLAAIYQKLCVSSDKTDKNIGMPRIRAVLVYLGLAKCEDFIYD